MNEGMKLRRESKWTILRELRGASPDGVILSRSVTEPRLRALMIFYEVVSEYIERYIYIEIYSLPVNTWL